MNGIKNGWTPLSNSYLSINDDPIGVIGEEVYFYLSHTYVIVKYSLRTGQWRVVVMLTDADITAEHPVVTFDNKHTVFIFDQSKMTVVDIKSQKVVSTQLSVQVQAGSVAKIIDRECHLFANGHNDTNHVHRILNLDTYTINSMQKHQNVYDSRYLFLPTDNSIFAIGGIMFQMYEEDIYKFCCEAKTWSNWSDEHLLQTRVNVCRFGTIVTRDGRYLILFGGEHDPLAHRSDDSIRIIDLQTKKVIESSLRCPVKSGFNAVLVQERPHHMLLAGFARHSGVHSDTWMSEDVLDLVGFWGCEDTVFLQQYCRWGSGRAHWKIKLKEVLSAPPRLYI